MDGEEESLNLATKTFNKLNQKSDQFDNLIGFPAHPSTIKTCDYLSITREFVKKLSPEDCVEIATELASYGIYIQRTLSKHLSHLHWIESKINLAIASQLNNFQGYYSFEQRKTMAILDNEYARQLEELRINTQVKVDMLSQIPYQINQLVRTLIEIQNTKKYQKA